MTLRSESIFAVALGMAYFAYSSTTPNFEASIVCIASFFILFYLFSNKQPSFLFAGLMMQWLSLSIDLIYSNAVGITLGEKVILANLGSGVPSLMNYTLLLSHFGLICYALGIYVCIKKDNLQNWDVKEYSSFKVIILYFAFFALSLVLDRIIFLFSGLSQLINFILTIKWGIFFIMVVVCIKKKENYPLLSLIVLLEFTLGFASYFSSSFANIFIFLFIAFFVAGIKLKPKVIIPASILISFAIYTMLIWTAIKVEYRTYLNQGTNEQVVQVNRSQALNKFFDLAISVDKAELDKAVMALINRIGYISFFSNTIEYIPASRSYANGKIYLEAFTYYLRPRILFPDKEAIDDSEHTREYTGLYVSGRESGSSISLGYIADAYADFGVELMIVPLFILGAVTGLLYQYFERMKIPFIWSWVMLAPFFFLTNINAVNAVKAVGPLLIYLVFGIFTVRFFVSYLDPLIRINKE